MQHLSRSMPHVKFILPTAPTQPVTMNMGMSMPSWYDIVGLDERSNEKCPGLEQSQARIAGILQNEHEQTGLSYQRMVLAGFSQGGALSLFTGLQLPQKLAAVVCMSGYLPAAAKFKITAGLEDTPVLHCHGTQDGVVQYQMAVKSQEMVQSKGAVDYQLKSYSIAHTVSPSEVNDVLTFLQKHLAPSETCKIQLPDPATMSVKELKAAIRRAGLGQQAVGLMEKREFVQLLQDYRGGKL
jgi:lysophospholipase II